MITLLKEEIIDNEINPEVEKQAFISSIDNLIQSAWALNGDIQSIIATFDDNYKGENLEDIKDILNRAVDDLTINIGMFNKAIELIDNKRSDLVDAGEEKAEELISSDNVSSEN